MPVGVWLIVDRIAVHCGSLGPAAAHSQRQLTAHHHLTTPSALLPPPATTAVHVLFLTRSYTPISISLFAMFFHTTVNYKTSQDIKLMPIICNNISRAITHISRAYIKCKCGVD